MPAKSWTSTAQRDFLSSRQEDFLTTQANGRLPSFLPSVCHDFFVKWPERDALFPLEKDGVAQGLSASQELELTRSITTRKSQIQSWFSWHCKKRIRRKLHLPGFNPFTAPADAPRTRMMHVTEVYSSLYYAKKIRPEVEKRRESRTLTRSESLALIREVTDQMWNAETDEVFGEVMAKVKEIKAQRDAERAHPVVAHPAPERTPAEFQSAIDDFIPMMAPILDAAFQQTGQVMSLFWAGPEPVSGGRVQVNSMHVGITAAGSNFAQSQPNFENAYLRPFAAFAREVFPAPVRANRALQIRSSSVTSAPHNLAIPSQHSEASGNAAAPLSPGGTPPPDSVVLPQQSEASSAGTQDIAPLLVEGTPPPDPVILPRQSEAFSTGAPDIAPSFAGGALPPDPVVLPVQSEAYSTNAMSDSITSSAPSWILQATAHLQEVSLDDNWLDCVTVWIKFEAYVGYGERCGQKCLPAEGRPREFSEWIKRARKYAMPPSIDDLPKFTVSFKKWWERMVAEGGAEGVLRTGGLNGFLVVMLLLCWWGRAEITAEWKAMVEEVSARLKRMTGNKRPTDADNHDPSQYKRYPKAFSLRLCSS